MGFRRREKKQKFPLGQIAICPDALGKLADLGVHFAELIDMHVVGATDPDNDKGWASEDGIVLDEGWTAADGAIHSVYAIGAEKFEVTTSADRRETLVAVHTRREQPS
jgi:hypothetical protein